VPLRRARDSALGKSGRAGMEKPTRDERGSKGLDGEAANVAAGGMFCSAVATAHGGDASVNSDEGEVTA
jgi:hypothetical protein